jgi:hypothetical protein
LRGNIERVAVDDCGNGEYRHGFSFACLGHRFMFPTPIQCKGRAMPRERQ